MGQINNPLIHYLTVFKVSVFLVESNSCVTLSLLTVVESVVTFVVDPEPHDDSVITLTIKNKMYFFIVLIYIKKT